jgi:serpin B
VLFDQKVNPYPGVALAFKQAAVDHAVLDFSSADSADKINARVREQTGGMIPEIVDRGPTGASLLVLNALHFKDKWKTPFDRADTKPEPFKRVGGQTVTVSTMHLPEGRYRFRQDARFTGIELPYSDPRFSMVVVTTRGERPAPVRTFRGASDWLSGKGFAEGPGELALPHFAVSAREDLTRPLDALGLREARLMPGALPGFTADPARITRLVQRIELRVNEEGTEASAATAVMAERGVDPNYVKMVVDKPFMFALRDNTTGLILIAGYVGQPSALATAAQ